MGKRIIHKNTSKKRKALHESNGIVGFINAISNKKYALANKYLQGVIQSKIQGRIESSLNKPLF